MENQEFSTEVKASEPQTREDFMSAFDVVEGETPSLESPVPQEQVENQVPVFEIDDKYKDLPHGEASLRTLQAKHDKLFSLNEKLALEQEKNSKIISFVNELLEDDLTLEAFLSERKPELIQKKDFSQTLQEKLNNEFPEFQDSKPRRDDADQNPGGKEWLYFKRLDELYSELKSSGSKHIGTIKELKEQKLAEKAQRDAELEREMQFAMKELHYSDADVKSFYDWSQNLKLIDMMKMHRYAARTNRIPNVNSIPGSPPQTSKREAFLKNL